MARNAATAKKANTAIARSLTARETRWATTVFGASLDYKPVRVHNTKAYFFQPVGTAISPNGEVYFTKADYQDDFSTSVGQMAWLIHELTHVWQAQHRMWVRSRGILNRNYAYGDLAVARKQFLSYGVEQQAAIIEDYFRVSHRAKPRNGSGSLDDYARTIPFLRGTNA